MPWYLVEQWHNTVKLQASMLHHFVPFFLTFGYQTCIQAHLIWNLFKSRVYLSKYVWIVLKENKQNTQIKRLKEALSFLKLCILTFMSLLILILSEMKDTLSPSLMIFTLCLCLVTTWEISKSGCLDEMNFMQSNEVWNLVELPNGVKATLL